MKVRSTLKKEKGVVNVNASYTQRSVIVEFDNTTIKKSELKKIIEKLGYKVN